MLADLRYAIHTLARGPAFTLVALISLAVGIGANTAIFSVMEAVLFRPLPVEQAEELMFVGLDRAEDGVTYSLSYPFFEALRSASGFSGVAIHAQRTVAIGSSAGAAQYEGAVVSGNYFEVLGVPAPAAGRYWSPDQVETGGRESEVIILSERAARALHGSVAGAIGREVEVNARPFTVIGVTPTAFYGAVRGSHADFHLPAIHQPLVDGETFLDSWRTSWAEVVARRAAGTSPDQALAALDAAVAGMRADGLVPADHRVIARDGSRGVNYLVTTLRTPLLILSGAVILLLLIACANVGGLLLARATSRQREIAIRTSLGGTRLRIIRQLLTESAVLAALAALVGVLAATWAVDSLVAYRGDAQGVLQLDLAPSRYALGFTVCVAAASSLLFGLLPALHATRTNVTHALRSATPRGGARLSIRNLFVIAQISLSLCLLVGSMLLGRSLGNLLDVELNMNPENVLIAHIDLAANGIERDAAMPVWNRLLEDLRTTPGVTSATLTSTVPPSPGGLRYDGVVLESTAPGANAAAFDVHRIGGEYFETLEIPIVSGRTFTVADDAAAEPVIIINETMAARYWPNGDALGRHIEMGAPGEPRSRIVGIARDGKYRSLREQDETLAYVPLAQNPRAAMSVLVRTAGAPRQFEPVVREAVRRLDSGIPVSGVMPMADHVKVASAQDALLTQLTSAFGIFALLLAALGVYGVLAYYVAHRTREIGVRMAIGARPADVNRLVLKSGLGLVLAGLLIGIPAALAGSRVLRGILFGVEANDPLSLAAAITVLCASGLLAAWLPARRATRVDPIVALRAE